MSITRVTSHENKVGQKLNNNQVRKQQSGQKLSVICFAGYAPLFHMNLTLDPYTIHS